MNERTHRRLHARSGSSRKRTLVWVGAAVALVTAAFSLQPIAAFAAPQTILGSSGPHLITDPDTNRVELGVRFSSKVAGTVDGVRFYKGEKNTGVHTGSLWSSRGKKLATVVFRDESASGWQSATFTRPVHISAARTYVASYVSPHGRYSADVHAFDQSRTTGDLTAHRAGGVYRYGGGFPRFNYQNSNYYVDVLFRADGTGTPATSTPTSTPSTPTQTPTSSPTQPPTTPTATPTPTSTPTPPPSSASALNLPRVPWEGGPDYWKQFEKANAAGWSDPSFFPILAWYDNFSSDSEVAYDKSLGINTYSGMWEGTPYKLFADNDVFWIGDALNSSFTDRSANWVGDFLGDEIDGTASSVAAGHAQLQKIVNSFGDDGRFKYANFTQQVIGPYMKTADQQQYVNGYTDAVSLDQYFYTNSYCGQTPYSGSGYVVPIDRAHCETASSYGKTVSALRQQDASDGKLQPIWQWIENFNGGPGSSAPALQIQPGQLEGAVMSSLIHEARGILYFNQSLSGSCQSGNIFRQSQVVPNFCANAQVAAVKNIDSKIHDLATVINTQSYQYTFGQGLDTMLKTKDGSAYIFAMVDGSSQPGDRTFQLPVGIDGKSVEALYENRTIPVSASGSFSDTFSKEFSYHIYKVSLK